MVAIVTIMMTLTTMQSRRMGSLRMLEMRDEEEIFVTAPHHALYTRTVVHVLYHIGNIDQYTHSLAGEHTLHVVVHRPGNILGKL